MASGTELSSLSAYAAAIALVLPFVAIGFGDRGWNLLRDRTRAVRTTIRPSEGKCKRRGWSDLADGLLHVCSNPRSAQCHQIQHVKGLRCWEQGFELVLNRWKPAVTFEDKPPKLVLTKEFVQIDFKTIIAFILMTDDLSISIQTIEPGLLILHSEARLQRVLTKDYVDRIIDPVHGYPPLLNDPKGTSILKSGDQKRGGWVAALGLEIGYKEDKTFLPYYYDCVKYDDNTFGDKRGHVFWRSMDRVREILENMFATSFVQDPDAKRDIDTAIKALRWIRNKETESGIKNFFQISGPRGPLQQSDKLKIIALFNGDPLLASKKELDFRAEWTPLLHYVLVAAVSGSERCMAYFKNPGRELDHILPMIGLKESKLYLRGC